MRGVFSAVAVAVARTQTYLHVKNSRTCHGYTTDCKTSEVRKG